METNVIQVDFLSARSRQASALSFDIFDGPGGYVYAVDEPIALARPVFPRGEFVSIEEAARSVLLRLENAGAAQRAIPPRQGARVREDRAQGLDEIATGVLHVRPR
jgi:hypothetical protein